MSAGPVVLGVDDHAVNAALAAAHLRRAGRTTETAADGAEVLRPIDRRRYDLVLLDISMPGISGVEACRALRDRPVTTRSGPRASTPS